MIPLARNLELPGGELDIVALDGRDRVAIEVRSVTGARDPLDAVGPKKRLHVRSLASRIGATRVDFLGVGLRPWGVEMHWQPG